MGSYPGATMAKGPAKNDAKPTDTLVAQNRKARFEYEVLETFEAGLVLTGTEVKSLRAGRATMVFDRETRSLANHNGEEHALWKEVLKIA